MTKARRGSTSVQGKPGAKSRLSRPAAEPRLWMLDPRVVFLNHGSFGACPRAVLAEQQAWRERMERQPVQFFVRDFEALMDAARARVAAFIGADADDLVFVPNATAGVNTEIGRAHV
mgnify:FL=1